jgi:murein DD-endopeptidase MepM/ murein hydrolase activator NlpD
LKTAQYIAILLLSIFGLAAKLEAKGGDLNGNAYAFAAAPSDTTEPTDPPKTVSDTSETKSTSSDSTSLTADTDPPVVTPNTAVATVDEDMPAGDLYDDWDTTMVHSDKFDALTFDDTVAIVLNDPSHCNYVHPFNGTLTSQFGFRKYRYHFGVDINLETGDSVKCCFDGKVRIAQKSKTYGYVVVVRHSNGLETYYAHLSKLLVHPGQDLNAGAVLGLGGNTGHSHGSHLHFEVRFRGQPIDPNCIIDFQKKEVRCDTYYLTKSDFKYLSETYKVKHYSRKKKKTWYTYYTPGGAHYATPEAKRIMAAVPPPAYKRGTTTSAPTANSGTPTKAPVQQKTTPPAAKTSPGSKTTTTTQTKKPATGSAVYYSVKKGDTLSAIAIRYNTTVAKICELNHIKSTSTLKIGQKLRVK